MRDVVYTIVGILALTAATIGVGYVLEAKHARERAEITRR